MLTGDFGDFQITILEGIATGSSLLATLDRISRYVESESENVRCAIAFVDAEFKLRPASAPNLPPQYKGGIDGVPVYPYIGPCGLAAYQKEQVISENIEADERWTDGFRALTKSLGLKACWSTPVANSQGTIIATFAVYSLEPGTPSAKQQKLMSLGSRLSGIALEKHLRDERAHLYAEIFRRSTEPIRILDAAGKIIEQNQAHRDLFGISDDDLLGKSSATILGEAQFEELVESFKTDKTFSKIVEVTIGGARRTINLTVFPVRRENDKVVCYASLNQDVTDAFAFQEALQKSRNELEARVEARTSQLRKLSARLLSIQDREGRRIARELHDSVGQYLAAIQMNLGILSRSATISEQEKNYVVDCQAMAESCTTEIRTISYLLHPPLLDESGLRSAIVTYAEGFAGRSGIRTNLNVPDDLPRLPSEIETTIFRTIQQSLANIHRHSGSSTAEITVEMLDGTLTVVIGDEGNGIPEQKINELYSGGTLAGVGIAGMRERIRELQGSFEIKSSSSGTTIRVSVPVSRAAMSVSSLTVAG
jgi:PAS domain S-box-containing protein